MNAEADCINAGAGDIVGKGIGCGTVAQDDIQFAGDAEEGELLGF